MEKVAKAGPIVLVREEGPAGPILNFIVLSGSRVQQVFSLCQRHLAGHPAAIELLEEFVGDLRQARPSPSAPATSNHDEEEKQA